MRRAALMSLMAAICAAAPVYAANVGDDAPKLVSGKFIKGEPVTSLEKGKVYVLEFWATWCGPCIAAMPHVSELQAKYKDVIFIGQNIWDEDDAAIEPFVAKMGDKMNFRVALDDKSTDAQGAMGTTWMRAAGRNSIPSTIIVDKESKIAWIGHPMEMEEVLTQVVAGTYDIKAAAAKAAAAEKAAVVRGEVMKKIDTALTAGDEPGAIAAAEEAAKANEDLKILPQQVRLQIAIKNKDMAGVEKIANEVIATNPELKPRLQMIQLDTAIKLSEHAKANALATVISESTDNSRVLNAIAWTLIDDKTNAKPDLDLILKIAQKSNETSGYTDAANLDTLASVHAKRGEWDKAIEFQTKAVATAQGPQKAEIEATLKKYQEKKI